MNYRIYATGIKGYEYITTVTSVAEINDILDNLDSEYTHYLVIQHDIEKNQDIPYCSGDIERNVRRRK